MGVYRNDKRGGRQQLQKPKLMNRKEEMIRALERAMSAYEKEETEGASFMISHVTPDDGFVSELANRCLSRKEKNLALLKHIKTILIQS